MLGGQVFVLLLYGRSQTWTEDKVRRDGVFLAHELLEQTPQPNRAKRLRALQNNFSVELGSSPLMSWSVASDEGPSGERIPFRAEGATHFIVLEEVQCLGRWSCQPSHTNWCCSHRAASNHRFVTDRCWDGGIPFGTRTRQGNRQTKRLR